MPPTANPNRFGALAGDTPGFPNGRRLADDVTDIELRVIGGALLKPEQGGKQLPLGDGVDENDKPFRTAFPYVALPDSGFDAKLGRDRAGARAGPAAARLVAARGPPRAGCTRSHAPLVVSLLAFPPASRLTRAATTRPPRRASSAPC